VALGRERFEVNKEEEEEEETSEFVCVGKSGGIRTTRLVSAIHKKGVPNAGEPEARR